MSNPRASVGFLDQFLEILTFKTADANLTKAAFNTNNVTVAVPFSPAVSMPSTDTVSFGTAGDRLTGGVMSVDTDGIVSVAVGGVVKFKYTGTVPVANGSVECNGDGTVRIATSNNVARDNTVYSIDTVNSMVYVNLH